MRTNKILAKVKAGEKAVGLQIPFCSPDLVELMGMPGSIMFSWIANTVPSP